MTYEGQGCEKSTVSHSTSEGYWISGSLNGKGRVTDLDGVYEGQFRHGTRHGYGIHRKADGSSYIGFWDSGNFHGYGIHKERDGKKYEGLWEHGKHRDGRQKIAWPDGSSFSGYMLD